MRVSVGGSTLKGKNVLSEGKRESTELVNLAKIKGKDVYLVKVFA